MKDIKSRQYKGLDRRVVVLLTEEQETWLQAHSTSSHISVAAIVRLALEEYRQRLTKKPRRVKGVRSVKVAQVSVKPVEPPVMSKHTSEEF